MSIYTRDQLARMIRKRRPELKRSWLLTLSRERLESLLRNAYAQSK